MRPTPIVLALILASVGVVWIGQGAGLIGGSFMTGSPFWAVAGLGLAIFALWIVIRERRRTPRR